MHQGRMELNKRALLADLRHGARRFDDRVGGTVRNPARADDVWFAYYVFDSSAWSPDRVWNAFQRLRTLRAKRSRNADTGRSDYGDHHPGLHSFLRGFPGRDHGARK